jgi:hypothetical protein
LEANEPEEMRHKKNVLIGRQQKAYTCSGGDIPLLPLLGTDGKGLRRDGRVWFDLHTISPPQDGEYFFGEGNSGEHYKMYEKKK